MKNRFIGNIEIPKKSGLRNSLNECYTLLKIWPEINYTTLSMHELAVSGYITNKNDLISMLLAEKKILFYLQQTNHQSWVDILHTKNGFGHDDLVIKYSDVYTRKDGWKNLFGITEKEIDLLKLSVEDVCYISLRLQMVFQSLGKKFCFTMLFNLTLN